MVNTMIHFSFNENALFQLNQKLFLYLKHNWIRLNIYHNILKNLSGLKNQRINI